MKRIDIKKTKKHGVLFYKKTEFPPNNVPQPGYILFMRLLFFYHTTKMYVTLILQDAHMQEASLF